MRGLKVVLFTVGVTVVFVTPISVVHLLTRPLVERNREVFLQRAVLAAAGIPAPAGTAAAAEAFAARARPLPGAPGRSFQVSGAAEGTAGSLVVVETGPGLWGHITAAVGLDSGRGTLTGIAIIEHTETPGLGARIEEPAFTSQFRGKRGPLGLAADGAPEEGRIDAITGATSSTRALVKIVNDAAARAGALGAEGD